MVMKLLFPLLLLSVCVSRNAISQRDSSVLLKEVEMKLQNHTADVSSILSDKAYEWLHPGLSFREMMQKHASATILTIPTADEPGKKIKVVAIVKNKDGQPVANALVYLYQTDSRG